MAYDTQILRTANEISQIIPEWQQLRAAQSRPHPDQDPEWLQLRFEDQEIGDFEVVTLRDRGRLVGVAPMSKNTSASFPWRLRLPGRQLTLAKWKFRQAELMGGAFVAAEDIELHRSLLDSVLKQCLDCQLVRFPNVSRESLLFQLLTKERRAHFKTVLRPRSPRVHWLIRFSGTLAEYESRQLSRSRRHEMRRQKRRFDEACGGQLRCVVVTQPAEVDAFIECAMNVATKSWRGKQLGTESKLKNSAPHLKKLAERGWFRAYVLFNGDEALAYWHGRIAGPVYYPKSTSFVPEWSKFSPGSQLLHFVLSDLFALGTVHWLDFGFMDLWYKEVWATQSYEEETIDCLSASPKLMLALAPTIATRRGLSVASGVVKRMGLEAHCRRILNRFRRGAKRS